MLTENKYYSYNTAELPPGCQMCVRGEKMVLFVTGVCPRNCYFCPISDAKYGKDVCFANEREIRSDQDLLDEVKAMDAQGAGLTGGDPLTRIDRTVRWIRLLKEKCGKEFHIHLYTSLQLVTEKNMQQLFDAGLDEIRVHLDLETDALWPKIEITGKFSWLMGIEIPLIPAKEAMIRRLVDFVHDKVAFLNLNELERSDNVRSKLEEMGLETKEQFSYAVQGSLELGLRIIAYAQKKRYALPIHLCTAKLKDSVQLAQRFLREAKQSKKAFDIVNEDGALTRGALYLPELAPGFEYRQMLAHADKKALLQKLKPLYETIQQKLDIGKKNIFLDEQKYRILVSVKEIKRSKRVFADLGLKPAIVTEMPTADQLELEVEFV